MLIPCYNEASTLPPALRSLEQQTLQPDEILVAEGGSTDGTRQVLDRWSERLPLRVIENPDRRPSFGLNRCLGETSARFVARLDGHSRWNRRYLELLVQSLQEHDQRAAAGGRVVLDPRSTEFQRLAWFCMTHPLGTGAPTYRTGETSRRIDSPQCPVYRRKSLEDVGGFREDLPWAEDDELHHRLAQSGWELALEPGARLYYQPRASAAALTRQFHHYGRGRGRLSGESIYPTSRHRIIDRVLLTWTGLLFWNPVGWGLGGLYLVSVLAIGLLEALRRGAHGIRVSLLFPLMHGSYWLGWLSERVGE